MAEIDRANLKGMMIMEKKQFKHDPRQKYLKAAAVILAAAIVISAFCACSKGGGYPHSASYELNDMPGFSDGLANDYEKPQEGQEDSAGQKVNEKLIKRVEINAETLKFDEAKNDILEQVSLAGGYISNSRIAGGERYGYDRRTLKSAELEIRIPQEKLDTFLKEVGGRINVYSSQEKITDATETYYDIQARLDTLNSKKEALSGMLEKAENTSQLLDIQEKLYQTIAEIESYKARLLVIDSQVNYSTVYLKLYEVETYTHVEEESFGKRVANSFKEGWKGFADGWKNFAVWFVGALPGLIVFAAFVVAAVFIIRALVKKSQKKAAQRAEELRKMREMNQYQNPEPNQNQYQYQNQGPVNPQQ